tara:strand:+ start:16834 stop:17088 length:255 start_codon:yes stop_codon:yes gene_type:complete
MKILTTFILVGMVDSFDKQFASVEINTNPATNGGPAMAVMPVAAFPCEIYEGKVFYVVKLHEEQDAVVVCQEDVKNEPRHGETD